MTHYKSLSALAFSAALLMAGCADNDLRRPGENSNGELIINLSGQISQEFTTRANDDGFADGDVIGVYIVDYEGNNPGTLLSKGNRGDNVRHTFNESEYRWSSAYDLFWKDNHTRIDVYGYYPAGSPEDVNAYPFTVSEDQSKTYTDGTMGNYEASDFLWGKVDGVEPTSNVIRLPMAHKMANARVTLAEGDGFSDGEWTSTKKQVLVCNTIRGASIDLATGTVSPSGDADGNSIIPSSNNDEWRAIVVPQTMSAGTQLFSITINGIPYKFSKDESFEYVAGKMNNFTIKVDKKSPQGEYSLTLISESITPWENDLVSHDATSKEYVVINVDEPGTLDKCITEAGKELDKLQNLKILGKINTRDFATMRYKLTELRALNLKEVEIVAGEGGSFENTDENYFSNKDNEIPDCALYNKTSMTNIVMPDKLAAICDQAFYQCTNLTGSLILPEGLERIGKAAFFDCSNFTGSLSLPSTLKQIGYEKGYIGYWDGAFKGCGFVCELKLPEGLIEIGMGAFYDCKGLYGNLRLPEKLERIGERAFEGCENLTGNLEIPQGVTDIPEYCFNGCWLGGNLKLHNGINTIGRYAFANNGFRGELELPDRLVLVSGYAFYNDDFSGTLVMPKTIRSIGDCAFAYNWRLMGTLEFGEDLQTIGAGAFAFCRSLEGLVLPESLENIRKANTELGLSLGAFQECYGIASIVSKSEIPPYVQQGAFDGVAKDNFTLEVPETAISQYQATAGWCDFKRIAAHHELVCRPAVACAISTEHKQTLVIDAEGDWELDSMPDWCELSQTSGSKKSEITLTIKSTDSNDQREGDVVFRLKDKDYTHKCHVTQYGYQYGEDEYITLQKASKGNNGGINIVILGDGYDAKDIYDGSYLKDMQDEIEYFFGIEPYTTYRDYFNVYTAMALSTETGVGTVNSIRYNRFETTFTGGVGLKCDYDAVFEYALNAPTVNEDNLNQTLIIIVPNSTDYGGICQMWYSGAAIAFCPKSTYGYPLDSRGVIQHEAGGHGFGKLADEYIYHNAFIDACGCTCCGHVMEIEGAKSLGWYDNIELTGKMHQVGWSHFIFDSRYSDLVDIYEGGFMHSRGVFRSEQNSCMNNNIPYYSTISRESIVRRIKSYAGENYSFEDFVANDKRTAGPTTRGIDLNNYTRPHNSFGPVIHKDDPLKNLKRKGSR